MSDTLDATFAHYYARHYDCSPGEGVARIALADALRPHLEAFRGMMRQRFAAHIDLAATASNDRESFVWHGRAKEASEMTTALERHLSIIDEMAADYAARIAEQQEERTHGNQ